MSNVLINTKIKDYKENVFIAFITTYKNVYFGFEKFH